MRVIFRSAQGMRGQCRHTKHRTMSSWNPNEVSGNLKQKTSESPVTEAEETSRAEEVAKNLHLDDINRHIFLCCDQSKAKCCSFSEGMVVWEHLKTRSRDWNRALAPDKAQQRFARTKANCLQVCSDGPIAVIYPDGVWYRNVTVSVLDEIIDQHLIGGVPVEEHMLRNAGRTVRDKMQTKQVTK